MDIKTELTKIFNTRHGNKEFDKTKKISDEDFNFILSAFKSSVQSFNLEPYKLLIVTNQKVKDALAPGIFNQPQVSSCSHLGILLGLGYDDIKPDSAYINYLTSDVRGNTKEEKDAFVGTLSWFYGEKGIKDNASAVAWATQQAYISYGYMLNAAAAIGVDSGAMEGFSSSVLSNLLKAELDIDSNKYTPIGVIAFGYAKEQITTPRTRKPDSERFIWAK